MKDVVADYFGSSYKNVVSFLVNEKKLSAGDLKKLIQIITRLEVVKDVLTKRLFLINFLT